MNWRKIAGAGILVLFLAGCAGKIIKERMSSMFGSPAPNVFAKLGLPDAEGEVAGRKFYVWSTKNYMNYGQQSYIYYCKLRVFVDSRDRITAYDVEGNEGGCGRFADGLSR